MAPVLLNSKTKDSSGKIIFGDPVLCSQFLNGYVDIPILKNVHPEDIEDVTNRFVHMFTEERNSDVVKKIRLKDEKASFYIVSLIEHKSDVDYNVTMQVLRYMVFIWEEYEKEMEKKQKGISKKKEFQYPPILPIIFYDGVKNWTAATRLKDKILLSDVLTQYIPDFQCVLVQLKNYSNAELIKRRDELSLIMLIDKLRNIEEFNQLNLELDNDFFKEVIQHSPEYLLNIVAHIIEILLSKLNVPDDEAVGFVDQVKERKMGELLSNFKGYDVQETRRIEREKTTEVGIKLLVQSLKEVCGSKEAAKEQLIKRYLLDGNVAEEKVKLYWEDEEE